MLHTILSNLPYISIGILVLVAVLLHKYWLLLAALAIFFIHRRYQQQQQEVILQQEPQVCPPSTSETAPLEELRSPTEKPAATHANHTEPSTYDSRQPSVPVTEHDPDQNHPRNDHTEIFDRLRTIDDKKTDLSTEEYRLAIKELFAQKEVNKKSKMYMVRQEEVPGKDKLE